MEITDENLTTLANYLQQTLNLDPNVRRPAEKFLEGVEVNQNYAVLLLHLIDKDTVDLTIRIAGAVAFKNYIKWNWPVEEDGADNIHATDHAAIRGLIVSLMLKSPEAVQRQFSDAVSIIEKYDFPEKWPGLISEMVEKFGTGDFHVINCVLRTAHSLFKKYRYEFKSQKLWEEIKHVLDNIAKHHFSLSVWAGILDGKLLGPYFTDGHLNAHVGMYNCAFHDVGKCASSFPEKPLLPT